ncbi:MAG TPA: glutamine synthetase III, partial [Spirochaetota bacterium]|nr:glutamine synthetase III [Spirochaetota bacterium]
MKPKKTTEVQCTDDKPRLISSFFGEETFTATVMKEKLPKDIYDNFMEIIHQGKKLDLATANSIAHAMKEWALEKGAT